MAGLLVAVAPLPASAQDPADTLAGAEGPAAAAPPADSLLDRLRTRYAHAALSPHAHGTLVGAAIRLPGGSARDRAGREGAAHLLARVRERQAAELLDPAHATLSARVERGATVYTLLAVPGAWRASLDRVDSLLFDAPVPPELVADERARLLETLRFEAGSPVRSFADEAAGLLAPPESSWATPVRGTPSSVEALDPAELVAWHREHVSRAEASVALAGPLPPGAGAAPGASPGSGEGTPEPAPGAAWRVGDRVALVQEVTSGWLSVAWPAPDSVPRTALELLAHLVEEELDPVPPDPDRYDVGVEVVEAPGGPVLQVRATLLPEALLRWEALVLETVAALGREPMERDFFQWRRRRFRAERLLAEAAPEAEAARMAADLAALGRARELDQAIWALDPAALLAAARALGEPRILLLGPDLGEEGAR